jgi:cytochrome oxidase assembly protein ShyY1
MAGLEGKTAEEIESLAELANSLASNPKTRRGFLSLTKQANPDTVIPEIDIPNHIGGLMVEPLQRIERMEKANEERRIRDDIEASRRKLGLSDEEIVAVEKVMVDNKIADHATAKKFMDMQSKQAEPTSASSLPGMRRFGAPVVPDLGAIKGDPKQHTYGTAYSVIDELRGRRAS